MPDQPRNLTNARELLSKFESEIGHPESLVYLSEALALLADVATDVTSSAELKQTCSNIASAYARKVQEKVRPLLEQESPIAWETIDHWRKVFSEFEVSDFTFPSVSESQSALMKKMVEQMPISDQKRLLQLLQDEFGESGV
jgi:hypothetical protein